MTEKPSFRIFNEDFRSKHREHQKRFFHSFQNRFKKEFNENFNLEILKSERLRSVLILLVLVFIVILILLNKFYFMKGNSDDVMGKGDILFKISLTLGFFFLYECIVISLLYHFYKKKKTLPYPARLMNAGAEVLLPSLIIYFFSGGMEIRDALNSPPTYGYFIFIILSTLRLDFFLSVYTGFMVALQYSIILYTIKQSMPVATEYDFLMYYEKALIYILAGFFAGMVGYQTKKIILKTLDLVEEKNEITKIFGAHVSPEVVNKLLESNLSLDSETKYVCILFLDIRNFTRFSESRSPEEVVRYLNLVFNFMIEKINQNNGIINKFLGDGFMAVFGAPLGDGKECRNAIQAVKEIFKELKQFNLEYPQFKTKIGVGIHSGEAVTGNIGSELRKEYTIIGDVVNTASRLEQLNKKFESEIILSESVKNKLESEEDFHSLGEIEIRGKVQPMKIFTIPGEPLRK